MAEDDTTPMSAGERDRAKDAIADDDSPFLNQEELLAELRLRARRPTLNYGAPGIGVFFAVLFYQTAPDLSANGIRDATSLFAQIAAAVLIVFSLEGRRAPRPDAMTFGLHYAYFALFFLMLAILVPPGSPGIVPRLVGPVGVACLVAALMVLLVNATDQIGLGAKEQQADQRLRYLLRSFLDRHR